MIDFSTELKDFDGNVIIDDLAMRSAGPGTKPVPLTLGRAASHALCAPFPDEQNLPGDEKFQRGMLAHSVRDAGPIDVTAEEIALIKKQIGRLYNPVVVRVAWPLLDPAVAPKAVPKSKAA